EARAPAPCRCRRSCRPSSPRRSPRLLKERLRALPGWELWSRLQRPSEASLRACRWRIPVSAGFDIGSSPSACFGKLRIRNGKPRAPFSALGNSASAGGRVGVESLDVAGAMLGLDAGSWHPQLERALAERYTDDEVVVRLTDRAGRRAAARDAG